MVVQRLPRVPARPARGPRRLRRLAAWSPWGIVAQLLGSGGAATVQKVAVGTCCAIVGVGGAVAVPEIAVHSRHLPEITAAVPVPVVPEDASRTKPAARTKAAPIAVVPVGTPSTATVVAHVATPAPAAGKGTKAKAKRAPSRVGSAASRMKRLEYRRVSQAMREFFRKNPSMAERNEMFRLLREMHKQRPGSAGRLRALTQLHKRAKAQKFVAPPRKGITPAPPARPAPTPTPTPAPPKPEPTAAPVQTPPAPTATPVPVETPVPTATAAPVETPVATPTP